MLINSNKRDVLVWMHISAFGRQACVTPSAARTGRMLIAQGAIDACKIGVTIAVRYGCARPQFNGKVVMSYLTHQRRLLPALATTYAMHLLGLRLKVRRPCPDHQTTLVPLHAHEEAF